MGGEGATCGGGERAPSRTSRAHLRDARRRGPRGRTDGVDGARRSGARTRQAVRPRPAPRLSRRNEPRRTMPATGQLQPWRGTRWRLGSTAQEPRAMTETITRGAANQAGAHLNKDAYAEAKDFLPLN